MPDILNVEQKNAYMASVVHALHYAENGEAVSWYRANASGVSTPGKSLTGRKLMY